MARVIREEMQDKDGNIHYFHTEDCIVFGEDGRNLRETMGNVQFEDYTAEGTEIPDAETALAGITKGKKWTVLFSNIKAFCKGVVLLSKVVDSENITEEGYLMSGKKCSEMFQEVSANFTMAADLIGDAISGLGVDVPIGASFADMASLITLNLIKKAVKSAITMKHSSGGHGQSGTIPVTETAVSGTAFTAEGSSIYVNHATQVSLTLKVYTYGEAGTISIQKNGITVASSPTGGSAWNFRTVTYGGNAAAGDKFRATWSGPEGSLMQDVTFSATGNN